MSEEIEWEELTEEAVLCFPYGACVQIEDRHSAYIAQGDTASWDGWCIPPDKTETEAQLHFEKVFEWNRRKIMYKARITSKNAPVRLLLADRRPFRSTLSYWVPQRHPRLENKLLDAFMQRTHDVVCWQLKSSLLTVAEAREPLPHLFQLFGVGL